ncbi:type III pantothenate kinase [candidate division KSB1 bacterium]|nr:type III pantothenate kinase [candidate division KSB1 bacterium]
MQFNLLAIDIGNTEMVIGLIQGQSIIAHWRFSSKAPRTADECYILLKNGFETKGFSLEDVNGVVISSVVPSLTRVFIDVAGMINQIKPLVVNSEIQTGLEIQYETPRMVGADRICNAVGGYEKFGAPLIIVDFGTATTFDVISEKGVYLGGAIALGLAGASHELHRLSAKLPRVDLDLPDRVVGQSTEQSIQSGIMWGMVSLVDGMVDRIQKEMKWESVSVIATGGMASIFEINSERIEKTERFLTLEGMRIIYERNQ